jgi:hypothetical protein
MDSTRGTWVAGLAALALLGCKDDPTLGDDDFGSTTQTDQGESDSSDDSGETETETESETETGEPACSCAPGTEDVHLLSDSGALWRFDPLAETFTSLGQVTCGSGSYYSTAVDHDGHGWLLDLDTRDLLIIDLADPSQCTEPPWVPGNGGFQYFGMGFVTTDAISLCESLYMLRYTGEGGFAEGPGIGAIGVYDPADGSVESLALSIVPLDGLDKTTASAFAFHSGDLWFFTEAQPPECATCLAACTPAYAACLADPDCAASLECMLTTGELTDDCGGLAPMELQNCVTNTCLDECFPPGGKVSEIHRLDWDESEGAGKTLTKLDTLAPVRVVGAGVSICAPFELP